jgi:hypothetical protein
MINFFNQGWVGALIGIVGVVSGYLFFRFSTIGPRLVYQWSSLKVIGKNEKTPNEIEIFYKGMKVPRIIKTTIIIWNSGKSTVDGTNIVRNDPLRFEFSEEEEVIRASIVRKTREVNGFEIINHKEQKNVLHFNFEFLDPKDGAIIEILHTDIKRYPELKGSIKGIPNGPLYWGAKSRTRQSQSKKTKLDFISFVKIIRSKLFMTFLLLFGIGSILFSMLPYLSHDLALRIVKSSTKNINSTFLQWSFVGILYISLPIPFFWSRRKRYPKLLDPERIEDDFMNDEEGNGTKMIV